MFPAAFADESGMKTTPHFLDALVWDAETWVSEFSALLDALELQFAIETEILGQSRDGNGNGEDIHDCP